MCEMKVWKINQNLFEPWLFYGSKHWSCIAVSSNLVHGIRNVAIENKMFQIQSLDIYFVSNSKLETNQPASPIKPSYITEEVQSGENDK